MARGEYYGSDDVRGVRLADSGRTAVHGAVPGARTRGGTPQPAPQPATPPPTVPSGKSGEAKAR